MLNKTLRGFARRTGIEWKITALLARLNYRRKVRIRDVDMVIPSIRGVSCDPTEPWMTDLLDQLFRVQDGAFLDVGVNVGQTLVKVKALDPYREYVGFEPNPVCVSYVRELIKGNRFERCTLFPVGLFTEDRVLSLDFFTEDISDSSATVIENFRPGNKIFSRILVPVFQFDSLAGLVGDTRFGIVKIDVEGAELEVVKSLSTLIGRDRPLILIELLPVYREDNTFRVSRQDELERIFDEHGYGILRVAKSSAGSYTGLRYIESIGVHSDLTLCDYVVAPRERLAQLGAS